MTQLEMDFYNFVRQLNTFFHSSIVTEGIAQTKAGSKRSVVAEVTAVKNSISQLVTMMETKAPKKYSGEITEDMVRTEASLNPFWFMDVWVATHIARSTEITGKKMGLKEATKILAP